MKESYLFDMSFNNVIFRGRNQAYGAYELRKIYSKNILAAAILATAVFTSGLAWPLLKTKEAIAETTIPKEPEKDKVTLIDIDKIMPPPPKTETVPEQPAPQPAETKIKTIEHVTVKVVNDNHKGPEKEVPTEAQLKGAIIGTSTQDGETSVYPNLAGIENGNAAGGTGIGEENPNTVYDFVAEMPYFEGGEEGLLKYISKKIKYPRQAVTEQVEGVVVVSFIVNQAGHVTAASILKGLGYGTDEEALRVINGMPTWTPGKQNGKPVAVRYTLPIRFSMKR